MEKVVLIGAGGYCSGVVDSLKKMHLYEIIGITDPDVKDTVGNIPIIGNDSVLEKVYESGIKKAHITVGSVGNPSLRRKLVDMATKIGFELISVIDPSANISSEQTYLGKMIYVAKNAVINSNVQIGDFCIINTGAIVEHGCRVGNFVHVAPGAVVAGDINIGNNSHIGLNASLLQGISIGKNVIVGAGSTVIGSVMNNQTVYGVVRGEKR